MLAAETGASAVFVDCNTPNCLSIASPYSSVVERATRNGEVRRSIRREGMFCTTNDGHGVLLYIVFYFTPLVALHYYR